MKTRFKIWSSIAGAIMIVVLGSWAGFRTYGKLKDSEASRQHRILVRDLAAEWLSKLTDAETAQRGFALTGDEAFLQPYNSLRDELPEMLATLHQFSLPPGAAVYLDRLRPLLTAKLEEMKNVIVLRRQPDPDAAIARVSSGEGKRIMDSIRNEMKAFLFIEAASLANIEASLQSNLGSLFSILLAASILTFIWAIFFGFFVFRESRYRLAQDVHLETTHLFAAQQKSLGELQQLNTSLQASEEQLAVTLKSIGDAVITTDAEGRIVLLNPLAEKLTGWLLAEAFGRPVDEVFRIISKETREPATTPVGETLAHGTIMGLANHTVLIARGGSESDIADSCAPIRDRRSQVIGAVLVFRDVTAEYALARTLREHEARMAFTLQTTHTGGWDFDLVKHCGHRTKEHDRIFGYDSELPEWTHETFLSHVIPEDRAAVETCFQHAAATRTAWDFECRIRRADGEIRWIWAAGQYQWDVRANIIGMTGIVQDITTRKLAEEALQEASALQNAIFNSANFSSIATDEKGVIQIFNVGAERMLGYTAIDVVNKITPAEFSDHHELIIRAGELSAELGTTIAPGFEALVFKASRGIEDIYELTYTRKDGSRFPAVVSVTALRDDQDTIIGYLLIGIDNTARKQVEAERTKLDQSLRDQQFYTRSLIESNIDALMTTDPQGNITDVNNQMEALTGCSREDLIGTPFRNYFTEPAKAEAGIRRVLREGKVTDYELTARARDGTETVVSYNATHFHDHDGVLQGVFAAARDITERKRWDKVLQENTFELEKAKATAEKANQAKSDFLSSMSHELRSPLNAILGFAQLIESDVPPPNPATKASIDQILHAGWYLLELINEILDLAVIESGHLSLSLEQVSIPHILFECQAMIEPQAQRRGIIMTFPAFEEPCFIRADHTRVKQVLINLLSNAIKYNQPGGKVNVCCGESSPGQIRISVQDTGVGLSPEKLAQLFQPFNRLGQEDGGEEGTGIGLVVSKRLVQLMQGMIGVESTIGSGSVFWIDLVAAEAPTVELPPVPAGFPFSEADHPPAVKPRLLLYVEDNPANMKLVEQLISRRPEMRLLTAQNGKDGIYLAKASLPDVILMDINLPGINGTEAMKILRQDPVTTHIPIIAVSANAIPQDIEKGLQAGFFRYLTKPIQVPQFFETLATALEHADSQLKLSHAAAA